MNSIDERKHVEKAVSRALREIGKRDFESQEKASLLAHEFKKAPISPNQELEKMFLRKLKI